MADGPCVFVYLSQALAAEADIAGLPTEELRSLQQYIDTRTLQHDAEALCDRAKGTLHDLTLVEQHRASQAISNGHGASYSGSNPLYTDKSHQQVSRRCTDLMNQRAAL